MKRLTLILLFYAATIAVAATVTFAQSSKKGIGPAGPAGAPAGWCGKSVALVVGIDKYQKNWP
jgi:hypothetical protein